MRTIATILTAAIAMFSVGILGQLVISFVMPSVSVAFLDGRVFRSWSGFGLRETALQALLLSIFLYGFQRMLHRTRDREEDQRHHPAHLMIAPMVFGAATVLLPVYLAIRIPLGVTISWGLLTLTLVVVGGLTMAVLSRDFSARHGYSPKRWWRRIWVTSSACLLLLTASFTVAYFVPAPLPDESFSVELLDGETIRVDAFLPPERGDEMPAVVVLHGVEGATPLARRAIHYSNARAISQRGYATFFVHYFDTSSYDHLLIKDHGQLDGAKLEEIRKRDADNWIEAVHSAIASIRARPDVDQGRLAIVGYSLGCYVGTAVTARHGEDGCPTVVVGNFGAIWPEETLTKSFPPIQFYHGADDSIIPLKNVRASVKRLQQAGASYADLTILPAQGHVPQGPASFEIRRGTEAFLAKFLAAPSE